MLPYRLVGYDPEYLTWKLVSEHRRDSDARLAYADASAGRYWQMLAVCFVSDVTVTILHATPHVSTARLADVPDFRSAARTGLPAA